MRRSLRESLKKDRTEPATEQNDKLSAEGLINKYSGMSREDLMLELKNATAKQRAEGSFDSESLKKGVEALLPMLSPEQQKRLHEIVSEL